jgi:hypothetical protein
MPTLGVSEVTPAAPLRRQSAIHYAAALECGKQHCRNESIARVHRSSVVLL